MKAIGYSFGIWRQTGYGVWLIWCDRSESYRSAKIRLHKHKGEWNLSKIDYEKRASPLSASHELSKAIAPFLVALRDLAGKSSE